MEANHNHNQEHPNNGFENHRVDAWQQTSGDKRKPQLNETVCGCECQHRNVIGEVPLIKGPTPRHNTADDAFLDGPEGVDGHLLVEDPTRMATPDQIRVRTRHSEYEINQDGTLLIDLESVAGMANLHRMNSSDSMVNNFPNSGEQSMTSSAIHSIRPESPAPVIFAIGAWSGSFFNIARSGYFFHRAPLPLVAPIVCCSCRSETDTESYGNSSVGSRMESTDLSEDDESMRSV